MRRRSLTCAALVLAHLPLSTAGTDIQTKTTAPGLTAEQIADKNVAPEAAWKPGALCELSK
jgi:hypothetical protein